MGHIEAVEIRVVTSEKSLQRLPIDRFAKGWITVAADRGPGYQNTSHVARQYSNIQFHTGNTLRVGATSMAKSVAGRDMELQPES